MAKAIVKLAAVFREVACATATNENILTALPFDNSSLFLLELKPCNHSLCFHSREHRIGRTAPPPLTVFATLGATVTCLIEIFHKIFGLGFEACNSCFRNRFRDASDLRIINRLSCCSSQRVIIAVGRLHKKPGCQHPVGLFISTKIFTVPCWWDRAAVPPGSSTSIPLCPSRF